jgi:hypothetical protein
MPAARASVAGGLTAPAGKPDAETSDDRVDQPEPECACPCRHSPRHPARMAEDTNRVRFATPGPSRRPGCRASPSSVWRSVQRQIRVRFVSAKELMIRWGPCSPAGALTGARTPRAADRTRLNDEPASSHPSRFARMSRRNRKTFECAHSTHAECSFVRARLRGRTQPVEKADCTVQSRRPRRSRRRVVKWTL